VGTIHVKVRMYGAAAIESGREVFTVEMGAGSTVDDLLDELDLKNRQYLYVARGGSDMTKLSGTETLSDGEEIIIIPPAGGG